MLSRVIGVASLAIVAPVVACSESDAGAGRGSLPSAPAQTEPMQTVPTQLVVAELPTPSPSFRRGINWGNRLDTAQEGERNGLVLHASDFPQAAERGFDHVRLPVKLSAHAALTPPYVIEPAFIERVDWAVEQALRAGLSIIVDFHHYDEIFEQPERERARFLGIWRQLAEHYAGFPDAVAFELLNEPHGELVAELWDSLAREALGVVRVKHPSRTVIVDGPGWSDPHALADFDPPLDAHVLTSAHFYNPQLFNFQGQSMGPDFATTGIVFPGPPAVPVLPHPDAAAWVVEWLEAYNTLPAEENPVGPAAIAEVFVEIDAFRERTGAPLYIGEWGVEGAVDFASHVAWLQTVRQHLDMRGLGWSVWELGEYDRLFDGLTLQWNQELLRVLMQ